LISSGLHFICNFLTTNLESGNEGEDTSTKKRGVICLERLGNVHIIKKNNIEKIDEESSGDDKSPVALWAKPRRQTNRSSNTKSGFTVHSANKNKRRVYIIPSNIKNLKKQFSAKVTPFRAPRNDNNFKSLSPIDEKRVTFIF
jgi:hypothetical protein